VTRAKYLILLLPLLFVGCSALDWFTGADHPETAVVDTPADKVVEAVSSTGPLGAAAATIIAFLSGRYVKRRKEGAA